MREFVYVSDGKLSTFLPEPRRFSRPAAIRLSTPVGGLDVEAAAADAERARLQRLKRVDQHLNDKALWFTEPNLRPGQWVWFEAPLHCVTPRGTYQHMVLFSDPAPGEDPQHERATGCRLLMHGSARHLLGQAPVDVEGLPLEGIDGGSSVGTTFLTSAGRVMQALSLEHDPVAVDVPDPATDLRGGGVRDLLAALDARHGQVGSAARVYGYAKVTADLPATADAPRCVVASPLTVEYAHD
ncbi:SAVMC3_10250 family protein [Streptomyces sp. 12297]